MIEAQWMRKSSHEVLSISCSGEVDHEIIMRNLDTAVSISSYISTSLA